MNTHIYEYGTSGPVIILVTFVQQANDRENLIQSIREYNQESSYILVVFEVANWNQAFSPWTSEKLEETFCGDASTTLEWLQNDCIKQIKIKYGMDKSIYLMGYSLAGLFALWALTRTADLDGVASCSGSLWYPDFLSYIKEQNIKGKNVYLSLGGKEAHTKNELMATIADCNEEVFQYLQMNNCVKYEMNSGGHFANVGKRLAKAVRWIVEK